MCCGMRSTYGKPNSGGELGPPPPHGDQIQRRSSPSLSQESGEKKKKITVQTKRLRPTEATASYIHQQRESLPLHILTPSFSKRPAQIPSRCQRKKGRWPRGCQTIWTP